MRKIKDSDDIKKGVAISISKNEIAKYCGAFEGSLTKTFFFLADLMEKACNEDEINEEFVVKVLKEHQKKKKQ